MHILSVRVDWIIAYCTSARGAPRTCECRVWRIAQMERFVYPYLVTERVDTSNLSQYTMAG
jgi:hypothetical protein